jgi:RHS repeat-associated protein
VGPAEYRYGVKDQPAATLSLPSYYPVVSVGYDLSSCAKGSDVNPGKSNWCANEEELKSIIHAQIVNKHPGCTVGQPVQTSINRPDPYKEVIGDVPFTITYGTVVYGNRNYTVSYDCNGTPGQTTIQLQKEAGFVCPSGSGWSKLEDGTPNDGNNDLTLSVLCKYTGGAVVTGPVLQVNACKESKHPCYPATGDKARQEPDFEFAGRTFTRHYHAFRQFRNNVGSAVGWSHTFDDRITGIAGSSSPAGLVDETGVYESFVSVSTGRLRGENSTGKVLETFASGTVRWRLRLPGGEIREFNVDGRLLKVLQPSDPRRDVTLGYANDLLATATDGQGRILRFQYDGAKLLKKIILPDGLSVSYSHDVNRNLTAVEYPDGRTRKYHYAEPGLIGDASQKNHLTGITIEGDIRYASFKYDGRGRVLESRVFGSPDNVTTLAYGSETQATMTTDTGEQRQYTMQPGLYRRITGRQSVGQISGTAAEYNTTGQVVKLTDRRGIVTEYGYTGAHRTSVTAAVGTTEQRRQELDYDPVSGRVTEVRTKDRNGVLVARSQWTYNARGQVTSSILFDVGAGATRATSTTYCESADVTAGTCPMVGLVTAVDGPRAGATDVVRYTYRMEDDPACASSPAVCAWRKGDLWMTTNALGQVNEILRQDGVGRVLSARDINGVRTDIEYDPHGRILARKVRGTDDTAEYEDQITSIEYEATGAVRQVKLHDGVITRYEYDAAQRMTGIVDSDGNRMRFVLNAAGERELEEVRDASGALLRKLSRTYDSLGRMHRQMDADGIPATYVYDDEGNLVLATDQRQYKTRHEYDALGRLRSSLQDVDGVAARAQYAYDVEGRVTQVLDPNNLPTVYRYNGFGDLERQESPDTGVTRSTYDEAGNLKTRIDSRNITATYGYDALNRLVSVSYPDSSRNVNFSYDTAPAECPETDRFHIGRLARMTDASGITLYCYDRFGYPTRKVQGTQGRTYIVAYDRAPPSGAGNGYVLRPRPADGHLYAVTYPDGARVKFSRNGQRQTTTITVTLANGQTETLLSGAIYYPFGAVSRWTYGNGRVMQRSRNRNYEPGYIEDAGPGGISIGYWFDGAGNLESVRRADQADPARRKYHYDGLNRLTEVRDGGTNALLHGYTYDKTGNRTLRINGAAGQDYAYVVGKHWLATVAGVARQYDVTGNTTHISAASQGSPPGGCSDCMEENPGPGDPGPGPGDPPPGETESMGGALTDGGAAALAQIAREFVYDDAGRMRLVKHDGVVAMSYLYNGKGERVHRTGGGQSVTTLYDEAGRWLGDYNAAGQPIQQAIWMGDLPVGLLVGAGANQKLYYVQADALGTPRVVIDPVRNIAVWAWDLAGEVFGGSAPNQDADGDGVAFVFDMRFPGQRHDNATGMSYNYYRDYDSSTGRYVQSDPIGLMGGVSTFGYVTGNPLKGVDPRGLADVTLELFAAGKIPRMPSRALVPEERPLETGVQDENQPYLECAIDCAPDKQRFDSHEAAVRSILVQVLDRSRDIDKEVCGLVCQDNFSGKYFLAKETWWMSTNCPPGFRQCPTCSIRAAWWHTHGAPDSFIYPHRAEYYSPDDKAFSNEFNLPGYLGTPDGNLKFFRPGTSWEINLGPLK